MKKNRLVRVAIMMLPILLLSFLTYAQSVRVKGTVTDEGKSPMPGANVVIKGTTTGVVTDANGKFQIDADSKSTLSFSSIGYKTREILVANQKEITIQLLPDNLQVDEVVVVGYGTQRKESVTGSVATVKGELVREVPSANITQAMQGRVAGVDMEQTSSKPGASMQIRIRGTRSLNASNDPLVVLDGIPFSGSIGDISPSDIKSLDILKDASSTAIYGSRGANGVILVTTNKGAKGAKAQFTYDGYYGAKQVFSKYQMMDGPQFLQLRKIAGVYPTNGADETADTNTDWQDSYLKTGIVTSHDLGISGGTKTSNYKFGLGYYNDQAVTPGQGYQRMNMRASLDQEIGNYIRVGFSTTNSFAITNNGGSLGIGNAITLSPLANPLNADGTWKRTIRMPVDEFWDYSKETINNLGDKYKDESKAYGSYNTVYGEVKIPHVDGLKYRINLGLNYRQSSSGSYTGEGVFSATPTNPSTASIGNSLSTNWAVENLITYDRIFAGKHQFSALAMYSAENNMYNSSYISAKDIPNDAFQFYNLGRAAGEITIDPNNQGYSKSGLVSYMGRVNYSYDNRYMVMASYRSDGSSRLAEGHKWVSYPAISVGWNINKESFMKDISVIDVLKLRVGYGVTSNQAINPYSTLGLLSTRPYNFGTTYATAYYVSALPNPNLGWEISKQMNYAVDFGILKNRLTGTIEYYQTKTENLLLNVSLPSTSGVNSYMANIGESQNKGLEFSLNGLILNNLNGFTWDAGVNIYTNHNELTKLASGATKDENNWWFVGHPIDVIYDYEAVGLWQAGDANLQKYEPGGNVGMVKVKYTGDYNADGTPTRIIGAADRQIMSMEAKFMGGFNTHVNYKGFDLTVVGAFKSGGLLISTPYGSNGYLNILTGRRGNVNVDYWTVDNTGAKYPKPGGIGGDQPKYENSLSYFDASYVKIRTISMGYNFTQKWVKSAHVDKLRLYATIQNPFVLFSPYTKETGMDPETNSYGNENSAVTMSSNLRRLLTIGTNTPTTRNYIIGISLTF
ncbi:MAG: TonB-dependent receptor [Prolixibacteraceae bacterium]